MMGTTSDNAFREPFVGHLPDYLDECRDSGIGPASEFRYCQFLAKRWNVLLDSPEFNDEGLLQKFFERHPGLLPGGTDVDGGSGHGPFPIAVISKPKLSGMSDREPDFMWIATDSERLYPI